jgi:hypothetical protein
MKCALILSIAAALLGGCAIVPAGYGDNRYVITKVAITIAATLLSRPRPQRSYDNDRYFAPQWRSVPGTRSLTVAAAWERGVSFRVSERIPRARISVRHADR